MSKGNRRKEIMDICPEGFEDNLKEFIDDLESAIEDVAVKLDISGLSELDNIEEAQKMAANISYSLY